MSDQNPTANSVVVSTYSYNSICRLCLKQGNLESLVNTEYTIDSTVLNFLEEQLNEKLPNDVCEHCLKDLVQISLFLQKCKVSQSILKQIETKCGNIKQTNEVTVHVVNVCESEESDHEEVKVETVEYYIEDTILVTEGTVAKVEYEDEDNDSKVNIPDEIVKTAKDSDIFLNSSENTKFCGACGAAVTKMVEHYKVSKSCYPKNFKCEECGMAFRTGLKLKNHKVAHHWNDSFPKFECNLCSKTFKFRENLKRHVITHKLGKRFLCETCGKGYTTKIQRDDHMNLHTKTRPFICSFCGNTFSLRTSKFLHEKAHRKDILRNSLTCDRSVAPKDSVECPLCHNTYTQGRSFQQHLTYHKQISHKCEVCQEELKSRKELRQHSTRYHNERSHLCSQCGKTFKNRAYLVVHMRAHTGERPYLCTVCSKRFIQISHLKYHMLLHQGEKMFKCTVCDKPFTLKGNLTVHMRVHTGERPYLCHVCAKGFYDSSSRKKHVVAVHGEDQVKFIRNSVSYEV